MLVSGAIFGCAAVANCAVLVQVGHKLVADLAELVSIFDGQVNFGQLDCSEDSDGRSLLASPALFAVAITGLGLVRHLVVRHCDFRQGRLDLPKN